MSVADYRLQVHIGSITDNFRTQIESVEKLMNFDREVLDIAIGRISEFRKKLTTESKTSLLQVQADNTITLLKNVRKNDSLRHRYETIFNQALVLLVSYFSSSMHDLFCEGVRESLTRDTESALLKEQFRMTFRELRDANFDLREHAPDLLVQAKDIIHSVLCNCA